MPSSKVATLWVLDGNLVPPFASVLLRSESASSSKIENLTSGAKSIALAELGSKDKRNATEIVGNVAAMVAALASPTVSMRTPFWPCTAPVLGEVQPHTCGVRGQTLLSRTDICARRRIARLK